MTWIAMSKSTTARLKSLRHQEGEAAIVVGDGEIAALERPLAIKRVQALMRASSAIDAVAALAVFGESGGGRQERE